MNLYKKYIKRFLFLLVLFISFNFVTYKLAVEELIANKEYFTGDIARLDYISGFETNRPKYDFNLTKKHLETYKIVDNLKYDKPLDIDILTMGDSFFHGGGYGLNPYFQDYLASDENLTVLDIPKLRPYNNFETIIGLLNNGFFEKIRPKYFIIGGLWTGFREVFSNDIDNNIKINMQEYIEYIEKKHYIQEFPKYGFVNSGNITYYLKQINRYFDFDIVAKNSYQIELDRNLFSLPHNKLLYYYKSSEDFKFEYNERFDIAKKMNLNFEYINKKLKEYNIKLIVLPIPSKLTLYNTYIKDKSKIYPEHNFIDMFINSNINKNYMIINSRSVLENMFKNNEKDIWYSDDTHWSFKASQKVSKHISSKLIND